MPLYPPATGGGTPGGSDTQLQFNDGGAFAGCPNFLYNKTTKAFTIGSGEAATDYVLNFNGPTDDGTLTWYNQANPSGGTSGLFQFARAGAQKEYYPDYEPVVLINDDYTQGIAGVGFTIYIKAKTNHTVEMFGFWGGIYDDDITTAKNITSGAYGVVGYNTFWATTNRTIAEMVGLVGTNEINSAGDLSTGLTCTNAVGVRGQAIAAGAAKSLTNLRAIHAQAPSAGHNGVNNYGLYVDAMTTGSSKNYAIYTNAGDVRLGGKLGCNAATPQGKYASGGAVTTSEGSYGFASDAERANLTALVANLRTALVNNGIMS